MFKKIKSNFLFLLGFSFWWLAAIFGHYDDHDNMTGFVIVSILTGLFFIIYNIILQLK